MTEIKRGDVILVSLHGSEGSEQSNMRPCVVISNNIANKFSPVITVAPLTSNLMKRQIPTHLNLIIEQYPIHKDSTVLVEQSRAIDKKRIQGDVLFSLNELDIIKLNRAISIQMGLESPQVQKAHQTTGKREPVAFAM